MAYYEVKGKVSHLRERVEQLTNVAHRRAPALCLLRRRGRRRLLGVIGSSSWVSGNGARVIWWSLMRRRGFWQLLAGVGFGSEEEQLQELSADAGLV